MKRGIFLSILSGLLTSLPFFSCGFSALAWFSFLPLFFSLRNKSRLQSFLLAYICGVVFWSLTIYWLVHVTLLGTAVLILYLALYFGAFGPLFAAAERKGGIACLFFVPATWVLLEYLRSHLLTGFPWALIGFSQYRNLAAIQIADITGAWGVSFLTLFFNTALYLIWRSKLKLRIFLLCAAVLVLSLSYGFYKLGTDKSCAGAQGAVRVAVIQGNIPQSLKWNTSARNFIFSRYKDLSRGSAKHKPGLIIWPEASVPGILGEDKGIFDPVFSLAAELDTDILAGAVSFEEGDYFNSALLIDKSGQPAEVYHKLHLVPFGEFVPLKKMFPFLQAVAAIGDIHRGREYTVFEGLAKFGVLICFEDLFPELSRGFANKGAQFLVNITNDAWYKETSAAAQHFSASVFRAVENRMYLARAANTGISGFVDPAGRILSLVRDAGGKEIFIKGFTVAEICPPQARSFYSRYGDVFVLFCFLLDACVIIYFLKSKKRND